MLESHKLLLAAGVGVALLLLFSGRGVGRALGNAAGGVAAGAVVGVGDALGLPDPADPVTRAEGVTALEDGDYLEASTKLPALDFLQGVGSQIGLALGELVYGQRDATAVHGIAGYPRDPQAVDPLAGWGFGEGA